MKTSNDAAVLRQIDTLFNLGAIRELTDGQLLERFSTGPSETAELAFAALVERHGGMVLRACRSLLADPHDAQDAFQATFLVLIKKAHALWVLDSLGPWLYQAAFRTASCARSTSARRRRHERLAGETAASRQSHEDQPASDWERVLHEEINRLPERYRVPIVLCDLEGQSCEEAARQMGRPVGTIKSWRSRGRERLRGRLTRRGLTPSASLAMGAARGVLPAEMARMAVQTMLLETTTGEVSASVRILVNGVLKAMLYSKLRTIAITLFAVGLLATGVGAIAQVGAGGEAKSDDPKPRVAPPPLAKPVAPTAPRSKEAHAAWSMTLPEAIRIALQNSKTVNLTVEPPKAGAPNGSNVIAPPNTNTDPTRFKAEVMAEVRAVEQQYWSLAEQHTQLWSSETAVGLAEAILKNEKSELEEGRGTVADVAEAAQRLEQFRLDLLTKTSNIIVSERQLHRLLGLPFSEDRRIVPVTAPLEVRFESDWEASLAAMLVNQPDIVKSRIAIGQANPSRDGLAEIDRRKALLQQTIEQATHSLSRFHEEMAAGYTQFKTAAQFREKAVQRLEAQKAFYNEGRITIDRYLDAVSQYTSALGQEAHFKTIYNNSIVAFEEAKGTLLDHDKIRVVDAPFQRRAVDSPSAFSIAIREPSGQPASQSLLPAPNEKPEPSKADFGGKTYTFHFTVGSGPNPLEIRGTVTVTPTPSADAPKLR